MNTIIQVASALHEWMAGLSPLFVFLLGCGATIIAIDEFAQYRARQSLERLQERPLERMRALKAVSDGYSRGIVDTTFKVRNDLMAWTEGVRAVDEAQAGLVPPPTEDEIELLSNITAPRRSNSRLSCQLKIPSSIDELIVFVPENQS